MIGIRCIIAILALATLMKAKEPPAIGFSNLSSPLRVSEKASNAYLVKHVEPLYPPEALAKCVEGSVSISIVTAQSGSVKSAQATSGPTELQEAAVLAVKQWQYVPYLVNGKKMELQTTATVDFHPPHGCAPKK